MSGECSRVMRRRPESRCASRSPSSRTWLREGAVLARCAPARGRGRAPPGPGSGRRSRSGRARAHPRAASLRPGRERRRRPPARSAASPWSARSCEERAPPPAPPSSRRPARATRWTGGAAVHLHQLAEEPAALRAQPLPERLEGGRAEDAGRGPARRPPPRPPRAARRASRRGPAAPGRRAARPRAAITGRAASRTGSCRDSTRWCSPRAISGVKAPASRCRSASRCSAASSAAVASIAACSAAAGPPRPGAAAAPPRAGPRAPRRRARDRLRGVAAAAHDEPAQERGPRARRPPRSGGRSGGRASPRGRRRGARRAWAGTSASSARSVETSARACARRATSRGRRPPPRATRRARGGRGGRARRGGRSRCSTSRYSRTSRAKPSTAWRSCRPGRLEQLRRPRAARASAPSPRPPPRAAGPGAPGATGRWRSGAASGNGGSGRSHCGGGSYGARARRGAGRRRAAPSSLLLLGDEALDGRHLDAVEARLAQERDEVVLLLAHAGVADREDLQEPQQLVPGGLGGEGDPAHAVAEEAEGERALAVPLEVDHLAAEGELEGVDVEDERAEAVEDRPEPVAVVGDQRAHDLVRRVVEGEAPRGAGEGEDRGVRGDGVGAAGEARLSSGRGLRGVRRAAARGRPRPADRPAGRRGRPSSRGTR